MRTLIIALLLAFLFAGCEPDTGVSVVDKAGPEISVIWFGVVQNYGYCDSTCIGHSTVLLNGVARSDKGYAFEYTTGPDSIWNGTNWLKNIGTELTYYTEGSHTFVIETNDDYVYAIGENTVPISLLTNTTYNLTTQ